MVGRLAKMYAETIHSLEQKLCNVETSLAPGWAATYARDLCRLARDVAWELCSQSRFAWPESYLTCNALVMWMNNAYSLDIDSGSIADHQDQQDLVNSFRYMFESKHISHSCAWHPGVHWYVCGSHLLLIRGLPSLSFLICLIMAANQMVHRRPGSGCWGDNE